MLQPHRFSFLKKSGKTHKQKAKPSTYQLDNIYFCKPILVWLMEESTFQIDQLPGFRFHPTEEELLGFYLKNTIFGKIISFDIIGFLNIYRHEPKDLPGNSLLCSLHT